MNKKIDRILNAVYLRGMLKLIDDKTVLKWRYKRVFNKKLDLENPKTFNEKLQWLKLNNRKPEYTKMVDKYEVKKYISSKIGEEYLIPTLGVYDKFEKIDFDKLPDRFVIKCTHDSGGIVICKDKNKLDLKAAKNKINSSLKRNYYWHGREWPYKNVKPRIIIEKYMEDPAQKELRDYKFSVFNGKVKCFAIHFDRFDGHNANWYDEKGNFLNISKSTSKSIPNKKLEIPKNLNKMIEIAEKLSKDIPFLRVDFYEVSGKIYFGELTFFPASGLGKFEPEEWDEKMGDWLKLPEKTNR